MKEHTNDANRAPISGWEDDGGAQPSGAAARSDKPRTGGPRPSEQERLDASHESDARGEHRYDDRHQTAAEQEARQQRDALKRRLAGNVTRRRRS